MARGDLAAYVVSVDSVDRRKHDRSYFHHATDRWCRSQWQGGTWCVRREDDSSLHLRDLKYQRCQRCLTPTSVANHTADTPSGDSDSNDSRAGHLLSIFASMCLGSPALFDIVTLLEIMTSTQYLDVRRVFRRTTLRVRDDVVEMKAGGRPALLAPPLIALPYF